METARMTLNPLFFLKISFMAFIFFMAVPLTAVPESGSEESASLKSALSEDKAVNELSKGKTADELTDDKSVKELTDDKAAKELTDDKAAKELTDDKAAKELSEDKTVKDVSEEEGVNNKIKEKWEFRNLVGRLKEDGFSSGYLEKIFTDPKVKFEPSGVSLFFIHSESSLDYDQFISRKSINNAREYMEKHKQDLEKAEEKYGVDKTIITAIILVETRLGNYLGNRAVINTLSTMAALAGEKEREFLWNSISDSRKLTREKFDKKANIKSEWAYRELKALLKYTKRESSDPVDITGSYAGAMGIAQFMPSNALSLARDGNDDGRVNLFDHADAIHSIANYLKNFGWEPSVTRQKAHKILYKYNHSNYYVDTLLKISDRLKE